MILCVENDNVAIIIMWTIIICVAICMRMILHYHSVDSDMYKAIKDKALS